MSEVNAVPVAFALLENKRKETYEKLFSPINLLPDWNPKTILMDFEARVILSSQALLPNVQIRGCNFHFNQCLWRKILDIVLINL